MAREEDADDGLLPVSWDEARELVVVALLAVAAMHLLSPVLEVIDGGSPGGFGDDLALITRNVTPTSGLLLIGAGVLIATTPSLDVVPALRVAVALFAGVVVAFGIVAITVALTRPSAAGVLPRLETVMARSGPGTILAAMSSWLARRVIPFPAT